MAAKKRKNKKASERRTPQPSGKARGNPPLPASAIAASACCLLLVLYLATHAAEIGRLFRWLAGR